jgi:sugar phosphate permease
MPARRSFQSDYRGLSVAEATLALTLFGVGGLAGQLLGGWVGQRMFVRYGSRSQCLLMGASTALGTFPMIYLINTTSFGAGFFLVTIFTGICVSITGPNIRAVLQVSPLQSRLFE